MPGVIHSIAAIGFSGQIGLNGGIPWHEDPLYDDYAMRDLQQFAQMTSGHVLIVGSVTLESMSAKAFDPGGRIVIEFNRRDFHGDPRVYIREARKNWPDRDIFICGGQKVYELFSPLVDWHHLSMIPYGGPADRYYPMPTSGGRTSGIVNHFNKCEAIPDNYLLLTTDGIPTYIGPANLVPANLFDEPGTISWVSPETYDRIATKAAHTGEGVPTHDWHPHTPR